MIHIATARIEAECERDDAQERHQKAPPVRTLTPFETVSQSCLENGEFRDGANAVSSLSTCV
jgi:hypothetical protein